MIGKDDLVILVADLDAENVLETLIKQRMKSLEIRPITSLCVRHPLRDSGCYRQADSLLRSYGNSHQNALVLFDHHGCGKELKTASDLETEVEERLSRNGWPKNNVACIVPEPELEIWVWANSPHVAAALGFDAGVDEIKQYFLENHLMMRGQMKPEDPKAVVERCWARKKMPRSSRWFSELAPKTSWSGCNERSFVKLCNTLKKWFPEK